MQAIFNIINFCRRHMLHQILFSRFHDFHEIRENRENRENELIQDEEIYPGARLFVTTGNLPP